MDGVAFQGMPRIALTPAEEALIPRPHSSASQVASAVPSAYSRTTSPQSRHPHHQNHHNSIVHHPYYAKSSAATSSLTGLGVHLASPSSVSIPISPEAYSRPSTPGFGQRPSSPFVSQQLSAATPSSASNYNIHTTPSGGVVEQEYPQNPQDAYAYYPQVPPSRSASPGPSRLAFALSSRPTRSPSPQLHGNLYDHHHSYQPRTSYFHRSPYDGQLRPGSPLQQEHQESWESSIRIDTPARISDSEETSEEGDGSDDECEDKRPAAPRRSTSKSILSRLRETTSRLSFNDDSKRPRRASEESERPPRPSQDSLSTSRAGKEVLQDLSDEEKQMEPRRSRSGWRPSLSLIRQESSSGSHAHQYLQNDPTRLSDLAAGMNNDINNNGNSAQPGKRPHRGKGKGKGDKSSKKKKRRAKRRRAEKLAAQQLRQQQQLQYEQQLAEEARILPGLTQVLEKRARYPLSYDDFEAFLRSQRAVEYLNFWADVTAHEQLCRTFDVSERRQKRESQLEERAIARDKRRMTLAAALESGRHTPDPDLLTPGHAGHGTGTGVGIGASGHEIEGSNLYVASRSSLQLPLNDHLSFPQESRRYGVQDSLAAFPPMPPSHSSHHGLGSSLSGAYNRVLTEAGGGDGRTSSEKSRPSMEEAEISEQDAAVAAVAMRAQRNGLFPYSYGGNNDNREEARRGSFDHYRPLPTGLMPAGPLPSAYSSTPNAYNLMMRGRVSADMLGRSNSRNSRSRYSGGGGGGGGGGGEDYFSGPLRRSPSHNVMNSPTPYLTVQDGLDLLQEDRGSDHQRDLQDQLLQQSSGFAEPDLNRRASLGRFGAGFGPLQPPVSIRRSGESGYTPSIMGVAQEGKALLVQSFRTIGLEDLQESAIRIYRKYLIQLRTASMAAEEAAAAAAASAAKEQGVSLSGRRRHSLEKGIAPGWDGYAEEVIADWNQKWQERRLRRLSSKRNLAGRSGGAEDHYGQPDTTKDNRPSLSIDTRPTASGATAVDAVREINDEKQEAEEEKDEDERADEERDEEEERDEVGEEEGEEVEGVTQSPARRESKGSASSPMSARFRKRTGTGLSSILNPFLTRLMRTETTVVELPTLTINTTTVEEAAVPDSDEDDDEDDDDDDDDDDDEDDDEDYDSDDEEDDGGEETSISQGRQEVANEASNVAAREAGTVQLSTGVQEETVVILDRSMPSTSAPISHEIATGSGRPSTASETTTTNAGAGASTRAIGEHLQRPSTSSSLSSSWDRITKRDLQKQVTIMPSPVAAPKRPSPYERPRDSHSVRSRTGKSGISATAVAQRVVSALMSKSLRSSSSSRNMLQVTPNMTPRGESREFRIEIPSITMDGRIIGEEGSNSYNRDIGNGLQMETLGSDDSFVHIQKESHGSESGRMSEQFGRGGEQGASLQPPKAFLTPATSSMTNPTVSSSPASSLAPSTTAPGFSAASPAAVAASAIAAAFYLPLECRVRIHAQIEEGEGRKYAPQVYGPAKGFVMDVVLQDHYYPLFLKYVERQNLGLLTRHHPNNIIKRRGMMWLGTALWMVVVAVQLTLILMGIGGWSSPWVWVAGVVGGMSGSVCLATGIKEFSPILGLAGKM
ncbi:hypothetical protein BGZ99_009571 [Dissophora globulifera]|uniref:RGS domain-containing protein n=1 Tax=Dissophora globulifera TaxID=979702 RepID=A0A9P6R8J3_9FUNG|nr:hypothetical protein BGZ99_009571 [Dissophora globulifera]